MTRRLLAVLFGLLIVASPAAAQDLPPDIRKVYNDYGVDGVISPCKHTVGELERTKAAIPPDIDQYAPDFPPLVDAALEAHARGDCAGKKPAPTSTADAGAPIAPLPTPTPGSTPTATKTVVSEPPETQAAAPAATPPGPPRADAQVRQLADARPANSTPAPVWMLGLGAAMLALGLIFVLVARRTTRGEAAYEGFRHAWGEAAWRTSGTWVDFVDWVRFGR